MFAGKGFDAYACAGDFITCEVDGFTVTATIVYDDSSGRPDRECDGFWPSLNPKDAGWIGDKSPSTLARRRARAQSVMDAWQNNEWFWCGIVLSVSRNGVVLDGRAAGLWGVECNYPVFSKRRRVNAYLLEVANELLPEAVETGRSVLERLAA